MIIDGLCDSPEEEREFVEIAYSSSEQLHQIINSVLDIAKIESGRMDVELTSMDIGPLLSDVYNLTRLQAEEKGLQFELILPAGDPVKVLADANKLRQILLNLIGNAVKFTERGSITISTQLDADTLNVLVKDTGIGISPEKQGRLFEPFVQADGSMTRRYGGTGLGLSISRHLAQMMGGNLILFSEGDGLGTLLTLKLPLAR
jgi:signal transduction histidine kinase